MNHIDIIDEHSIIRETVGYEVLNQVPIEDMPKVMEFLKIVYNYNRMKGVEEPVRKFKLDDSFKKALEEAPSWMDEYREEYDKLLKSGMFFEFHPTWTGEWEKDRYTFCHGQKFKNKVAIKEKLVEKISEDEAKIREILNDPSSMFVGYSQEGYNLHIWINQGKKYYIEPELNRINKIER